MKTLQTLLVGGLLALLLTQCAPAPAGYRAFTQTPELSAESSKRIEKAKPKNLGTPRHTKFGMYDLTVYKQSVVATPTSGVAIISIAEVHDLNRDGVYDSVFAKYYGTWRFGTILGRQYRLIGNSLDDSVLRDYIQLANTASKAVSRRKTVAPQRKPAVIPAKTVRGAFYSYNP